MTTAEPRRAGATLAALNSGSGLHKLVKMGSAASSYAPSDVEVAHIEAQFTGPDLHESAKELLQSSASEEVERRALLDRMQEFDMVMDRVDAHGSAKMDGGLSDVHTASTHGLSFDSAQVRPFPPARPIRHQPRCAERTTERATRARCGFFLLPPRLPPRAPRARDRVSTLLDRAALGSRRLTPIPIPPYIRARPSASTFSTAPRANPSPP